jgi:SAM-dependent methyltransferase
MVPLDYWVLRLARRATPQAVVDLLLDRGLYLKPGRDTSDPAGVARSYAATAAARGKPITGATVCVLGYGGGLGVGLYLLEAGAGHVVLQDPFAPPRTARNRALPADLLAKYVRGDAPDPARITLVHERLEAYAARHPASVDRIVSSSVLEHVDDVPRLIAATRAVLRPDGHCIHGIDLRDHFFKHPFEMLCYDGATWARWLDASNHLNRLRLPDYERAFRAVFAHVELTAIDHLRDAFRAARPRIRPEFLTGDEDIDAVSSIQLECWP